MVYNVEARTKEIEKSIAKTTVELPTDVKVSIDKRMRPVNSVESCKEAVKIVKAIQANNYTEAYQKMFDASIKAYIRDDLTDIVYKAKSISIKERREVQDVISELVIEKIAVRKAKNDYSIRRYQMEMHAYIAGLKVDEKLANAGFIWVQGVKDNSVKDWVDEVRVAVETYEFLTEWESLKQRFTEVKVKIGTSLYGWKKEA